MQWLMKNEGYPPAVIVSVLLHGLLLLLIVFWDRDHKELLRIEQPATIVATAVKDNPQRVRQQETKRKQQQQAAQERERVKEQERQHQEKLASEEAERQKLVQQVQQQAQQQKEQQQKQQQKQQELDQKRKQEDQKQQAVAREETLKRDKEKQQQTAREEAQRQAEQVKQKAAQQRALTEEQQLVAKYEEQIRELIESNWNRPAVARKETVAQIELQLTPTGEIVSSRIVQSSGDANFDSSVLRAVAKAGRFNFLIELNSKIFNQYFRQITLEFKPGDSSL